VLVTKFVINAINVSFEVILPNACKYRRIIVYVNITKTNITPNLTINRHSKFFMYLLLFNPTTIAQKPNTTVFAVKRIFMLVVSTIFSEELANPI
jgi:hypothetical protein